MNKDLLDIAGLKFAGKVRLVSDLFELGLRDADGEAKVTDLILLGPYNNRGAGALAKLPRIVVAQIKDEGLSLRQFG